MSQKISVTLTGPAKIAGKWCKSGDVVDVGLDLAFELEGAGVIAAIAGGVTVADLAPGAPGFDAAVRAALEAATADLVADLAATRQRLADADVEVHRQHARIMQLEADLASAGEAVAALTAENTEGGNAPTAGAEAAPDAATAPALKAARKKGAGAADQG